MLADVHIHMVLDGLNWKAAIDHHRNKPDDGIIRERLERYQKMGITWLRDGGDAWGVCSRGAELAPEYGINYCVPVFPIYKKGHYGSFIGREYETLGEFRSLVREVKARRGNFIKIMLTGLMDFNHYGVLTSQPLPGREIKDLVNLCHDAGFCVMVHCNGAKPTLDAIAAGADSLEHGAYLDQTAALALAQSQTIWVPTLSTIGNLIGSGRYSDEILKQILHTQTDTVRFVWQHGGHIALGSDAGAYRVFHAQAVEQERTYLASAIAPQALQAHLLESQGLLQKKFQTLI